MIQVDKWWCKEEFRNGDHKGGLYLTQKTCIDKVLSNFSMQHSKVVKTPTAQHFKLSNKYPPQLDEDVQYMKIVPYANAISLTYLMVRIRYQLCGEHN